MTEKTAVYMAPLEGITMMIFRNAVRDIFGGDPDKFFTPFLVPHSKKGVTAREMRELGPDNNRGIYLVPQILTRSARDFLDTQEKIMDLGYEEVNLNLGCPSGTVVSKGRGSGLLKVPDELDRLLYGIFSETKCRVSVKTRIGFESPDEFPRLLEIFNKYEMEELIIHPRVRTQMYDGNVNAQAYGYALENSKNTLCYNGDILAPEDMEHIPGITETSGSSDGDGNAADGDGNAADGDGNAADANDKAAAQKRRTASVMIGRGMVRDPSLIRQIKGGKKASADELISFMERLTADYKGISMDERQVLCKLKEIMAHMAGLLNCDKKTRKTLMKTSSLDTFKRVFNAEAHRALH